MAITLFVLVWCPGSSTCVLAARPSGPLGPGAGRLKGLGPTPGPWPPVSDFEVKPMPGPKLERCLTQQSPGMAHSLRWRRPSFAHHSHCPEYCTGAAGGGECATRPTKIKTLFGLGSRAVSFTLDRPWGEVRTAWARRLQDCHAVTPEPQHVSPPPPQSVTLMHREPHHQHHHVWQ